jgi:glycosyltransferase involved in cell wall biosynthesis
MPKVTFGIIVLNGEPFTRYCLRGLYPFAHEIIVVEGGHEDTRAVATSDGHSTDGTLEVLRRFCAQEDPQRKVTLVTRDGFWPKTDELGRYRTPQSREYAERATGDYLWQVDIDEFYRPHDVRTVLEILADRPSITAVSFNVREFWGSLDVEMDGWGWRRGGRTYHRLFKWGEGYRYLTHEPPTVLDQDRRELRELDWVSGDQMAHRGIYMFHCSHLFPSQVRQKTRVYNLERPSVAADILTWANTSYFRLEHPFHVGRVYQYPGWLRRYGGDHPPEVLRMMADIRNGLVDEELRPMDDAERLLSSSWYHAGILGLSCLDYVDRVYRGACRGARVMLGSLCNWRERSGWLRQYQRDHPAEVLRIMEDIRTGRVETGLGDELYARRLLASAWYRAGAKVLSCLELR